MSLRLLAGVVAAVLFVGCASTEVTTRYYLLSDPGQLAPPGEPACSVQLGSVAIAPYLQRTHIMLQTGSNELVPALHHRWSEPLDAGVARLLGQCLGGGARASQTARVEIDHLHGSADGEVVLQARWRLDGGVGSPEGRFSSTVSQASAGYDSLVSAQRELVLGLCSEIRAELSCEKIL